jgi:hypothetical protein
MLETVSAILFTVLTGVVIIFQGCLAAGLPWGEASMGGKYPGKYPPKMRVVAVVNMLVLAFIAAIVLSEAHLLFPQLNSFSRIAIWVISVFFLASTIMNAISPSKKERFWTPVALIQLITCLIVAIGE